MARTPQGYWEERQTELMKSLEKGTEMTIKSLIEAYETATKNINKEISKIFNKYATDGKLTKKEAQELLTTKETKEFYDNLLEQINSIKDIDVKRKLLAKYNAPAYSYRISRYEALQQNINVELKKLADIEQKVTEIRYIDTINEGYYHNIYNIQKGSGLGFSFAQIDNKTIQLMLAENWINNGNFSKRIWENSEKLGNYLKVQLTADTMAGKSVQKMSKQLSEYMNVGLYNATRLIRTEVSYFANQSQLLSLKECEMEKYRFIATLDIVTCSHCAELDNQTFYIKDSKTGINSPPIHPNDRCIVIGNINEEVMEGLTRRARDPITGETYLVDQDMSYKEWKKSIDEKYGNGTVDLEHKKHNNLKKDKEQYKRYKSILEKNQMPSTFEEFQKMKYNNIEKYNDLKGYYRYKSNYPESNRQFYEINNSIKQQINLGNIKKGIGTAVKPNTKKINISTINEHAEKRMKERNITKQMAQSYVDNAIIEFSQKDKNMYLSKKGVTVLLKEDKRLISTYSIDYFDNGTKKILEVINNGK